MARHPSANIGELLQQARGNERLFTVSNVCSMVRLVLVPFIVTAVIRGGSRGNGTALVLMVIAFLLDIFDGYFARRFNGETRLGRMLDPIADKTLINAVMLTLVFCRDFPWWFAAVVIFRDLSFIIFGYSLFRGRDVVLRSNRWGKTAAFFMGGLIFFYVAFGDQPGMARYHNILVGICLTLIVGSGLNYLNRFIHEINGSRNEERENEGGAG